MACTFTLKGAGPIGNGLMQVVGTAVFDSSYATGGEVLDLSTYLKSTSTPVINVISNDDLYTVYSDGGTAVANKVIAVVRADGNQAGSTSDLSAVSFNVVAYGQQAGTS